MSDKKLSSGNIIINLIWKFMERISVQAINLIIQILLARKLFPEDFAAVAIITVFINIATIFVQSGFGTALIQKAEIDELDSSSIFYFSISASFILYIILFFAAPYVADFYHQDILKNLLRAEAIILVFGAFNTVQQAILARNLEFKKNFKASLLGCIASGITGVVLAYAGAGIWALAISTIVNNFVLTVVLWFSVRWRPKLIFSLKRVKTLFSFSWKLVCSSLVSVIYTNVRTLIIGKAFKSDTLGYYNRGDMLGSSLMNGLTGAINAVMLPVLSTKQDKIDEMKKMLRRTMSLNCFVIFPVMFGLVAVSKPLILILFTDKWLNAVPFMQLVCIAYAFYPMHSANLQAINALGRSDVALKLEVIKRVIGLCLIGLSFPFGVYAIVGSEILFSLVATIVNGFPNKYLINYSIKEQWTDIIPYLILAIVMSILVYSLSLILNIPNILLLIIQIIIGIMIYIIGCHILKLDAYTYMLNKIKSVLSSRK